MEIESQPPAEVIDLMSSIASKYGDAARAQSSNGHEGGTGPSDPLAQLSAVREVLREIGASDVPELVVVNKAGKVVYTGLGGKQNLDAAIKKAL